MRSISTNDLNEIIPWLLDMRLESPVYCDVPLNIKYSTDYLHSMLNGGAWFGVIEPGAGCMFGTVTTLWYDPRAHAFEQVLYISPERRGGMLAAKLIKAFESECRSRGAIDLTVGNSAGVSDSLEALYKRLGYEDKYGSLTKRL